LHGIFTRLWRAPEKNEAVKQIQNAGAADVVFSVDEVKSLDNALDVIPMPKVFGGTQ
jgi:hypothetical protein